MGEDVHDFLADFDENALNDLEQRLAAANAQAHSFLNSPHLADNQKPECKSDLPTDASPERTATSLSRTDPVSRPAKSEETGEKDFLAELEREVAVRVQDLGAQQGHHAKPRNCIRLCPGFLLSCTGCRGMRTSCNRQLPAPIVLIRKLPTRICTPMTRLLIVGNKICRRAHTCHM